MGRLLFDVKGLSRLYHAFVFFIFCVSSLCTNQAEAGLFSRVVGRTLQVTVIVTSDSSVSTTVQVYCMSPAGEIQRAPPALVNNLLDQGTTFSFPDPEQGTYVLGAFITDSGTPTLISLAISTDVGSGCNLVDDTLNTIFLEQSYTTTTQGVAGTFTEVNGPMVYSALLPAAPP